MVKIIIKAAQLRSEGRQLEDLIKDLKEPLEEKSFRLKILADDFREFGNGIIEKIEKTALLKEDWTVADDSREGVKIIFNSPEYDGFFILRMSVHDPVMPLNIESAVQGGVRRISEAVYRELGIYPELDISALSEYVKN